MSFKQLQVDYERRDGLPKLIEKLEWIVEQLREDGAVRKPQDFSISLRFISVEEEPVHEDMTDLINVSVSITWEAS